MVMLNVRGTLWCILGILFVILITSAAFAQQEQQPDSALTQSQADKIIEKINELETNMLKGMHELETNMRDHVDKKIAEVNTNITELKEDVANIKGQLTIIKWGITVFGAPLLIGIVVIIVQNHFSRKNNAKIVSEDAAEATSEVTSEPTSEVASENRLDPSVFLRQDDFRDKTQSDSPSSEVKPDDRR